jgi:nicotinamidase-related amidase
MPKADAASSVLLLVDFQARLMPAIEDGGDVVANARRLLEAAGLLGIPAVFTEQNPAKLGGTVPGLDTAGRPVVAKMTFDACGAPGLGVHLPAGAAVIVAGCEAHVCVLQTVLGLIAGGRHVLVAADAIGSRRARNREAAVARMRDHGADIVTTEMVVFEWLGSADHPRFREVIALIK